MISITQMIFLGAFFFLPLWLQNMFSKTAKTSILVSVSELSTPTFLLRFMPFLVDTDSLKITFYLPMFHYDLLTMQTHFGYVVKLCSWCLELLKSCGQSKNFLLIICAPWNFSWISDMKFQLCTWTCYARWQFIKNYNCNLLNIVLYKENWTFLSSELAGKIWRYI